jgi:hypothetical protein
VLRWQCQCSRGRQNESTPYEDTGVDCVDGDSDEDEGEDEKDGDVF